MMMMQPTARNNKTTSIKQPLRLNLILLSSLFCATQSSALVNPKQLSSKTLLPLPTKTRLYYDSGNSNNNQFDISKPTFDLLSFRLVRSDALLRYNSLNQSEPLRINLFLLMTVTLLGFPLWCESVTGELPTNLSALGACAAGVGCASLFNRERSRRSNQLNRMEKELNAERLEVKLPVSKAISSTRPTVQLKELRGKRRIVAIRGNKQQLTEIMNMLCSLRRRFVQSQTLMVLVPTDGSKKEEWGWDDSQMRETMWLADASNTEQFLEYFRDLLGNNPDDDNKAVVSNHDDDLTWFALNFKGRSIASGIGEAPKILELMGQQLQPIELIDETDPAVIPDDLPVATQILECQKKFYNVLTSCSEKEAMEAVFTDSKIQEVSEVIEAGGRIDGWDECLKPDARPRNMVIADQDVFISSPTLAYSTCVEFPPNAGIVGATLLAKQRWVRKSADDEWKLELHQTIPWSTATKAGGTLRCDCRGCVALTRSQEKRTFGGIIG